jgi:hypothetical protein
MGWKHPCWICGRKPTDTDHLCKSCRGAPFSVINALITSRGEHEKTQRQLAEARTIARGLAALVDNEDPDLKSRRYRALEGAVIAYHAIDEKDRPTDPEWPDMRELFDDMERHAEHEEQGVIDLPRRKGT